ncbi:hypothetical protein Zmor_019735 [Zophobas morio]|uniref:Gustatory receptor n=2 Tax=Zophobas morio TaxID=2755281 RepID=A0AA38M953_9CUCU|nr:hypothetical protein Zmor_019735 [Zophobas morio]
MFDRTKPNVKTFQKFFNYHKRILIQSQIFGLVSFTCTNQHFRSSKRQKLWIVALILIYLSLTGYVIYAHFRGQVEKDTIPKISNIIILSCCSLYVSTIWLTSFFNGEKIGDFLQKVVIFDDKVQLESARYHKTQKRILVHMVGRFVFLTFYISYFLFMDFATKTVVIILTESCAYVLLVMNSVMCHQAGELILMLRDRFKVLNKSLDVLIRHYSSNINVILKKKPPLMALNTICTLHHHLSKLIKIFNEIFGVVLLFMFGVSFIVIVLALFFTSGELQRPGGIKWLDVFYMLMTCVSFVIDTVYMCDVCYSTIQEASKSGELIHKIETEEHDLIDEIEMFSLQIANEQVEFNAAGFFPINYTLVFSIIGGVTTYIIILIQLSATLRE